jgi:hypothetical protein
MKLNKIQPNLQKKKFNNSLASSGAVVFNTQGDICDLELWINETLKFAGINGVATSLRHPEHIKPLA